MRIAITISSLPQLTTNQMVGLSIAQELERRGHSVDIYCMGHVTRERVSATFHIPLKARIFGQRSFWAPGSTIYDYPLMAAFLGPHDGSGYDFVFEAIGPVIHLSRKSTPRFTYVFFPPNPDLMGDGKFKSGFWRFYSAPYRVFYDIFSDNVSSTRVLSISDYIAGLCKEAWGVDSDVVYFPVPYSRWTPISNTEREGIITLGRFSPEKKQLEQIRIAESLRGVGVTSPVNIVGAVSSSLNYHLYAQLRNEAEKRGVSNVNFHPNMPQKDVISLAHSSKVFLHTMVNEHFGIATVEAIAAGCVPIVHDSGGSREIVPIEELRFRTEGEATEKVKRALGGEFDKYLPELSRYISRFSEESFRGKVTGIILSEVA